MLAEFAPLFARQDIDFRPKLFRPAFGLRRPKYRILGADLAGQVEAVGKDVTRFRPGDEVYGQAVAGAFVLRAAALAARSDPVVSQDAVRIGTATIPLDLGRAGGAERLCIAVDALDCPQCQGRMQPIAVLTERKSIVR